MLIAPADSPKRVMLAGSPPKAVMFSCTHSRAAIWSSSPRLASPSPRYRNPSAPTRQLMTTQTMPSRAKWLPSYGADDWISNMPTLDPHHDRQPGGARVGCPHIQDQTVLTGRGQPGRPHALGGGHLWGLRSQPGGVAYAAPRLHRLRRAEPVRAERRRRVGSTQEGVHLAGDAAAQFTVHGLDQSTHKPHGDTHLDAHGRGEGPRRGQPSSGLSAGVRRSGAQRTAMAPRSGASTSTGAGGSASSSTGTGAVLCSRRCSISGPGRAPRPPGHPRQAPAPAVPAESRVRSGRPVAGGESLPAPRGSPAGRPRPPRPSGARHHSPINQSEQGRGSPPGRHGERPRRLAVSRPDNVGAVADYGVLTAAASWVSWVLMAVMPWRRQHARWRRSRASNVG